MAQGTLMMDMIMAYEAETVVHRDLETIDPTPQLEAMFSRFDERFFNSILTSMKTEITWSTKMTSCAGICYMKQSPGQEMKITIRLSAPLLQMRPRKDMVETLLHEMIHARLFIQGCRAGHDGHGGPFLQWMYKINQLSGSNVTIYHTFHDEVKMLKVHQWVCNGSCRTKHPYYGRVSRANNRAPGPSDSWYSKHLNECGGTFTKVKGPEFNGGQKLGTDSISKAIRPGKTFSGATIKASSRAAPASASSSTSTTSPQKQITDYFKTLSVGHVLGDKAKPVITPGYTIVVHLDSESSPQGRSLSTPEVVTLDDSDDETLTDVPVGQPPVVAVIDID